jgi:hypothetical protein
MNEPSILEAEAQRARWAKYREACGFVIPPHAVVSHEGLAGNVRDVCLRMMVLPVDPDRRALDFNKDAMSWLTTDLRSPYANDEPLEGVWYQSRPTSQALVRYRPKDEETPWRSYVGLHRSGALEFGDSTVVLDIPATDSEGAKRVFALETVLMHTSAVMAMATDAARKWRLYGPYETSVVLYETAGAQRYTGIGNQISYTRCLDDHIVFRFESKTLNVEKFWRDFGNQCDQAFGDMRVRF